MEPKYKNIEYLYKWIEIFGIIFIVMSFLAILPAFEEYQLYSQGINPNEMPIMNGMSAISITLISIFNLCFLLSLIIGSILFFKWIYRANYNAHVFDTIKMKFQPGWSVGWWLIPIAGLFLPYFILKEIWCATQVKSGVSKGKLYKGLIFIWWLTLFVAIISSFIGNFTPVFTQNYQLLGSVSVKIVVAFN